MSAVPRNNDSGPRCLTLLDTMEPSSYPDFDDLPKVEGMPQGCAWGVFDKDGKKDLLGTLNFLTPQVVQAAAAEVKAGVSISLKHVQKTEENE